MKPKTPRSPRSSPTGRAAKHPVILLVDDEPVVRLMLKMLLEHQFAAKVVEAGSNAQAFRAARRQKFDLVISDYGRAGGDGLAFLRRFKALHPNIPVIIHSGHAAAIRQRARRLEANACIAKPLALAKLKIVGRLLATT